MAGGPSPSRPVRHAFRLVVAAATLLAAQVCAAATLLARFDTTLRVHGPWTSGELTQAADIRIRLVGAVVLGAGLAVLLAGAAVAVPRRSSTTRAVVGLAALLTGTALLLGVVYSPDSALLPSGPQEAAHLDRLLPLWFSALSSTTVVTVIGLLAAAVVRMGHESAVDYYQRHDPTATWPGFISWLHITR